MSAYGVLETDRSAEAAPDAGTEAPLGAAVAEGVGTEEGTRGGGEAVAVEAADGAFGRRSWLGLIGGNWVYMGG